MAGISDARSYLYVFKRPPGHQGCITTAAGTAANTPLAFFWCLRLFAGQRCDRCGWDITLLVVCLAAVQAVQWHQIDAIPLASFECSAGRTNFVFFIRPYDRLTPDMLYNIANSTYMPISVVWCWLITHERRRVDTPKQLRV